MEDSRTRVEEAAQELSEAVALKTRMADLEESAAVEQVLEGGT